MQGKSRDEADMVALKYVVKLLFLTSLYCL